VQISQNETINSWFVSRLKSILSDQIQISASQAPPQIKQARQAQRVKADDSRMIVGGQQIQGTRATPHQQKVMQGAYIQGREKTNIQMSVQGNSTMQSNI
jgi:hypothetical protein